MTSATPTASPTSSGTTTPTAAATPTGTATSSSTPSPLPTPATEIVDVTMIEPAATLVMPFDATDGKASFQVVSRVGGGETVATHWSYWAADGRHLIDVMVCLTPNDTKVMDVRKVQAEIQTGPANLATGPLGDLNGERGIVVVTAYASDPEELRTCRPRDPVAATTERALVGAWTIADATSTAAYGGDAIGLAPGTLPDPEILERGLWIPSFNPESLERSTVILIGLETMSGTGDFADAEPGPIAAALPNGARVCCELGFFDTLENRISLPSVCFDGVGFGTLTPARGNPDDIAILPPSAKITTSGVLELTSCVTAGDDGQPTALGLDRPQFLFAFHGQVVGPYGAAASGKYLR